MYDIYIPQAVNGYNCYFYSSDNNVLYATNDVPTKDTNIQVKKILPNQHYIITSDNYNVQDDVVCLDNNFTNNIMYRNDIVDICVLVLIFSVFFFYIPLKIFSKLFKRGDF